MHPSSSLLFGRKEVVVMIRGILLLTLFGCSFVEISSGTVPISSTSSSSSKYIYKNLHCGSSENSLLDNDDGTHYYHTSSHRTRNIEDPDYIPPTSLGGYINTNGMDGAIVFIAKLVVPTSMRLMSSSTTTTTTTSASSSLLELRAQYFARKEEDNTIPFIPIPATMPTSSSTTRRNGILVNTSNYAATTSTVTKLMKKELTYQEYKVPGDVQRGPYMREVTVKVWGAGGGGCDGGRGEVKDPISKDDTTSSEYSEDDHDSFDNRSNGSQGAPGGYVEATFLLPVGDILKVIVGGGGGSQGSQSHTLGGKGGYNGGTSGLSDLVSGGGGGGGMSMVSTWNGTILIAAFGGDGGGNTTYCTARGGLGGMLHGEQYSDTTTSTLLPTRGGGGYINLDLAVPPSDEAIVRVCPGVPEITALSHNFATFTWDAGSHQDEVTKESYVQKYTVSFSYVDDNGSSRIDMKLGDGKLLCSNKFVLHKHIERGFDMNRNATTRLDGLKASTFYCLRVEAFSSRGLILGKQIFPFRTKPLPINEWLRVTVIDQFDWSTSKAGVTHMLDDNNEKDNTLATTGWCEHSHNQPTGRRGHSMTIVSDQVYIFGGATMKCVCDVFDCLSKNVYSNELWHFNPFTSTFSEFGYDLSASGAAGIHWPRGREHHSMTALTNGFLVLIGGRSSTVKNLEIREESDEVLLADVWTMKDPHHIISSIGFSSNDHSEALPIELVPGHVTSHRMPIFLHDDSGASSDHDKKMCIHDVQVQVSLDRICPNAIDYILLTGPSTMMGVADHDMVQSYDYETKIIITSAESRESKKCHNTSSTLDLLLYDGAQEWVLSYATIPEGGGSFRPANSLLDTFKSFPIDGEWVISIAMAPSIVYPEKIHHGARLLQWKLVFDAKPCTPGRAQWKKLSNPPPKFLPRHLHSAIAVDNSIFITGGYAKQLLNDLWRYDYDTDTWVELKYSSSSSVRRRGGPWPINHGQVSVLGPFGLLSFGGISKSRSRHQGNNLRLLNIFDGDWKLVQVPHNESNHDGYNYVRNSVPENRYFSSIGLLNNAGSIYKRYKINNGSGPIILVYGGDGMLLHNAYANNDFGQIFNTLFDDVWLLSPGGIRTNSSIYQRKREDDCRWRWMSYPASTISTMNAPITNTAYRIWNTTCGWRNNVEDENITALEDGEVNQRGLSPGECHLESILIAAWCREQYQSFYIP